MRGHTRPLGAALGLALGLAQGAGCSEYIPTPEPECQTDAECGTGSLCSLETNTCVPEALAPRDVLGFDISEVELRTELHGCDPEVSRELGGSELRVAKHSTLFESFDIRAERVDAILNGCTPATCDGECDPVALTCTRQLDADLGLLRDSRLTRDPVASPTRNFEATPDPLPPEGELPPAPSFTWPRYAATFDPLDLGAPYVDAASVLHVEHAEEASTIGDFYRVLASDASGELVARGTERCMRSVRAEAARVHTLAGQAIGDANITFLYDEPIATPSTVLGTPPSCSNDEDCAPGWACYQNGGRNGSCGLDLTREVAGTTLSYNEESGETVGAFPPAYLYTYCEEFVSDIEPLVRTFVVRVKPPDSTGLPTIDYRIDQEFQPGLPDLIPPELIAEDLCMPNWREPKDLGVSFMGSPVALKDTELGTYTCCSTDCLPSNDAEEPQPPPNVDTCSGFDSAVFETTWINDDEISWLFQGCAQTVAESGASGRYARNLVSEDGQCPVDGCTIPLTPGDEDEMSRSYSVSIRQPPNSVLRSQRFNVTVQTETESLPTFELEPRVLLRGRVECDNEDCSTVNAVVVAEQLRTGTGEDEILGPYLFQTRVDPDGSFVLPVDPGRYVMTAYPASSEPGAPAPYRLVDVREGAPGLVETVDGAPTAQLSTFALSKGVLVRVQLRDFDISTTAVTPIDTGSWTYQDNAAEFEDVDLNAPETCLTSSTRGCAIRRVRATDTPLPLLLAGQFQFTTRDRGSDSCPE